jgi:hypothetical protein
VETAGSSEIYCALTLFVVVHAMVGHPLVEDAERNLNPGKRFKCDFDSLVVVVVVLNVYL